MLVWLNMMSQSAAAQLIKITILPGVIAEAVLKLHQQNVWQNSIISKCCRAAEKDERKTKWVSLVQNQSPGNHIFYSIFTETANDNSSLIVDHIAILISVNVVAMRLFKFF